MREIKSVIVLLIGILNFQVFAQDSTPSPAQVAQAEALIKKDPSNLELRRNLIRYYENRMDVKERTVAADKVSLQQHRIAYISNNPDAELTAFSYLGFWLNGDTEDPEYLELKKEWIKQISFDRSNSTIRYNAFNFFSQPEPELAETILKDGQQIDPNDVFYSTILIKKYIEDYQTLVDYKEIVDPSEFPAKEREHLDKILSEASKGIALLDRDTNADEKDKSLRSKFLAETAKAYLELDDRKNAGVAAESLLKSIGKPEEQENWLDVGSSVALYQTAMSVLGRIQLREGNIKKARDSLLTSVNSLDKDRIYGLSFDTKFLSEFLAAGGSKTILEYLRLFKPLEIVSEAQKVEIKQWENDLSKGRSPEFNKSQSNLY